MVAHELRQARMQYWTISNLVTVQPKNKRASNNKP
jgi:hypothetical protein